MWFETFRREGLVFSGPLGPFERRFPEFQVSGLRGLGLARFEIQIFSTFATFPKISGLRSLRCGRVWPVGGALQRDRLVRVELSKGVFKGFVCYEISLFPIDPDELFRKRLNFSVGAFGRLEEFLCGAVRPGGPQQGRSQDFLRLRDFLFAPRSRRALGKRRELPDVREENSEKDVELGRPPCGLRGGVAPVCVFEWTAAAVPKCSSVCVRAAPMFDTLIAQDG